MLPQTQDIFNGMDPFDFIPGIVPDDGNELWWDAPLVIEGFDLLGVYPPPAICGPRMHQLTDHYHHGSSVKAPHCRISI